MPVPYLGNALKGWVEDRNLKIVNQTVVDHETQETETDISSPVNLQPMPAAKVNRKPEEQRTWKWWSLIIQDDTLLLKTDDILVDDSGNRYRIEQADDWRSSGFTNYEAVEDYT